MKRFLVVFALCILGVHAIPMPNLGRVANGEVAVNAQHACLVIVHRPITFTFGGGSIISTRHVLTSASVVSGIKESYQILFFVGSTHRSYYATFALIHEDFKPDDLSADIALIFLVGDDRFPIANAISIAVNPRQPIRGVASTLVGFGFTSPYATGPSSEPYAALQIVEPCAFGATADYFCGGNNVTSSVVCPGDNGSGLYTTDAAGKNNLVGIASHILPGCAQPQLTGYTRVGLFTNWIKNITGIA